MNPSDSVPCCPPFGRAKAPCTNSPDHAGTIFRNASKYLGAKVGIEDLHIIVKKYDGLAVWVCSSFSKEVVVSRRNTAVARPSENKIPVLHHCPNCRFSDGGISLTLTGSTRTKEDHDHNLLSGVLGLLHSSWQAASGVCWFLC